VKCLRLRTRGGSCASPERRYAALDDYDNQQVTQNRNDRNPSPLEWQAVHPGDGLGVLTEYVYQDSRLDEIVMHGYHAGFLGDGGVARQMRSDYRDLFDQPIGQQQGGHWGQTYVHVPLVFLAALHGE